MLKKKKTSGFTLIELLVVISIIAILSTIAIVNYGSIQKKSRGNQAKTDISTLMTTIETYKSSHLGSSNVILANKNISTSNISAWNSFWTSSMGMTKPLQPPVNSLITYQLITNDSGQYSLCATGGNMTSVLSTGKTFWVGSNGELYENTTCPNPSSLNP
jgi:prepilin-type N-terminal cleavage/methylation domain-containing protein